MLEQFDQFNLQDDKNTYTVLEIFKYNGFDYLLAGVTADNLEIDFNNTIILKTENNTVYKVEEPNELKDVNNYILNKIINE